MTVPIVYHVIGLVCAGLFGYWSGIYLRRGEEMALELAIAEAADKAKQHENTMLAGSLKPNNNLFVHKTYTKTTKTYEPTLNVRPATATVKRSHKKKGAKLPVKGKV
jgi:uncharacterized membrane protein YraQ (UPF0718 family)